MGGAIKYFSKKLLGHEIFRSMVSWATNSFLGKFVKHSNAPPPPPPLLPPLTYLMYALYYKCLKTHVLPINSKLNYFETRYIKWEEILYKQRFSQYQGFDVHK